jgi:hypothetical protein
MMTGERSVAVKALHIFGDDLDVMRHVEHSLW